MQPTSSDHAAPRDRTPGVRLEPFTRADFTRLISWVPDEVAMFQWAGAIFTWPLTEAQLEQYLLPARPWPVGEGSAASGGGAHGSDRALVSGAPRPVLPALPQRLIWSVADVASGEAVGHVELNAIDPVHRSTTLSRVLVGPEFRGRGFARAMIADVLPVAFDDLGMHRVDLVAFEYNEPALRCYRSLGFTREGVMRDVRFIGGSFVNSVVMSLLEDEWRASIRR